MRVLDIGPVYDVEARPSAPTFQMSGARAGTEHLECLFMKYVVLIYSNPATWETLPATERDRVMGIHNRLIKELTESGEMLRVDGLARPNNTKTVRLHDGVPVVTDGPFSEAKEQLAGVWALDVESIERAIEVSAPVAEYDIVEVRPLMDLSGLEM